MKDYPLHQYVSTCSALPARAIVLLLILDVVTANIVDLSADWSISSLYNRSAAYCTLEANLCPSSTIGYLVAQNGLLVAEGYTCGNSDAGQYDAFSVTKSFSSYLIGKMVELAQITITDTLGDIFDTDADWDGVTQAAEKKSIPLSRLLTMTSGLVPDPCTTRNDQSTLQDVLNYDDYDAAAVGSFNYLATNHIMSRIIQRRSGQTPRQFVVSQGLFSNIGISENDYGWTQFGGVEGSAYGLMSNPRILAKLGQLYLQNGMASSTNQLIPSSWVASSEVDALVDGNEAAPVVLFLNGYGYQWYNDKSGGSGALAGAAAALGANGQVVMYLPASNTTIAVMGNGCDGSTQSRIFVQSILDNLNGFSIQQTSCERSGFSYWDYYRRNGVSILKGRIENSVHNGLLRGGNPLHV